MRNRLLIFGRFADDPQRILTTIYRLAFMRVELGLNISTFELSIATFAHANRGSGLFHNSQLAFRHTQILTHLPRGAECP
jgi:hypothetical protein